MGKSVYHKHIKHSSVRGGQTIEHGHNLFACERFDDSLIAFRIMPGLDFGCLQRMQIRPEMIDSSINDYSAQPKPEGLYAGVQMDFAEHLKKSVTYHFFSRFYMPGVTAGNGHGIVVKLGKQPLLARPFVLTATFNNFF